MTRIAMAMLAALVLVAPAQAEMIDNPEYTQWAKFNVGATATRRQVTTYGANKTQMEMTFTLKSKGKDTLVLTMTTVTIMTIPGQGEKKFPTPPTDREVPAKMQKVAPPKQPADGPKPKVTQGKETLEVSGQKLECTWFASTVKTQMGVTTSKSWMCDKVPGHLVKMTATTKGPTSSNSEMLLTSFKAP